MCIHWKTVVAILIKNSTPHQQCISTLQAIALRATCHKTITICSIYLSPSIACNITELEDLIRQLPPPVLLLWDFNAHSQQWGCNKRSPRGKMVEDFLLKSNLFNSGSPTYLHHDTASISAIDLSIAHPALNGTLIPVVEQTKFLGVILTISSHSFNTFVTWKKNVWRRWTFCVLLLTLPGEPTSTHCYIFIDRLFALSSTMAVSSMVPRENLTYIGSDTEPRTATMPRFLQNFTCLKYVCSSQWTSTLHTAKNVEHTVFP